MVPIGMLSTSHKEVDETFEDRFKSDVGRLISSMFFVADAAFSFIYSGTASSLNFAVV